MIGGIEVRIPTRAFHLAAEVSVRAIRRKWPTAVFEDGLTGVRYPGFRDVPFGKVKELFVYRDADAADLWDAEGAVPAALNSMIHLIVEDDALTAVVDSVDHETAAILATIRSALSDEILCFATPEAA